MDRQSLNRTILIVVVLLISAIFIAMIRQFLMVILITGIFAGMTKPIYNRFEKWFGGRKNLSSALTLVFISLIIFLPLLGLLGIVAGQAIKITVNVADDKQGIDAFAVPFSGFRLQVDFCGGKTGVMAAKLDDECFFTASLKFRTVCSSRG